MQPFRTFAPTRRPIVAIRRSTRLVPALLVAAVAALLVVPAVAGARPVLTNPGDDARLGSTRPTFSWTLEPGTAASQFEVARTASLDAAGDLASPDVEVDLVAEATQRRPTVAQQLWAGRWYWHVTATRGRGTRDDSEVRTFRVMPRHMRPQLTLRTTTRGSSGLVRVNTNSRFMRMRVKVVHGRRTCLDRTVTVRRLRARLHVWDAFKYFCYPPTALAAGARSYVLVRTTSGGITRTVVRRSMVG